MYERKCWQRLLCEGQIWSVYLCRIQDCLEFDVWPPASQGHMECACVEGRKIGKWKLTTFITHAVGSSNGGMVEYEMPVWKPGLMGIRNWTLSSQVLLADTMMIWLSVKCGNQDCLEMGTDQLTHITVTLHGRGCVVEGEDRWVFLGLCLWWTNWINLFSGHINIVAPIRCSETGLYGQRSSVYFLWMLT